MAVVGVVPVHEARRPAPRVIEIGEALDGIARPVFGRPEQRFHEGIVVADPRTRVGGRNAQSLQHRQHRRSLQAGSVVAVQDGLMGGGMRAFSQRRSLEQLRGMIAGFRLVHYVANDLAAIEIQNQVEIKPSAGDARSQPGHVPAPHLARCRRHTRGGRACHRRRFGASAVRGLGMLAQYPVEAGFAGDIAAFVSQARNDLCGRQRREPRSVRHTQNLSTFGLTQRMRRSWTHCTRTPITVLDPVGPSPLK